MQDAVKKLLENINHVIKGKEDVIRLLVTAFFAEGNILIEDVPGVGKTTICAVMAQLFANDGLDVMAIDADPAANLCSAFGIDSKQSPEPLIKMKDLIAQRTGTNKDALGAYFKGVAPTGCPGELSFPPLPPLAARR